jgi:hypothetical protein
LWALGCAIVGRAGGLKRWNGSVVLDVRNCNDLGADSPGDHVGFLAKMFAKAVVFSSSSYLLGIMMPGGDFNIPLDLVVRHFASLHFEADR